MQNGINWARIEGSHYSGAIFDEEDGSKEWDALFVASPQVVNAGPGDLRMYYHSFDTNLEKYLIGLARSKNGFDWKKMDPLLLGGSGSGFDSKGVAAQCVVSSLIVSSNFSSFGSETGGFYAHIWFAGERLTEQTVRNVF